MAKVTWNREHGGAVCFDALPGETLLEAAQRMGLTVDAPCGGSGVCGKCKVKLLSGTVDELPGGRLSEQERQSGWRLACRSRVTEDITVFVPDHRSGLRTAALSESQEREKADNGFFSRTVSLCPPSKEDPMPDSERLIGALKKEGKQVVLSCHVLKKLAAVLRQNGFSAEVVGEETESRITVYDICAPGTGKAYGLAVDIGTTTVAAVLLDLLTGSRLRQAVCGNGQIAYGADVISRIMAQEKPGGAEHLRNAVVNDTLLPLVAELCRQPEKIYRVSIAANTTMNHLLLGADAAPIRMEPYVPTFFRADGLKAVQLGLPVHECADLLLAPNVGSYVGGDITAGIYAAGLWEREAYSLFLDLGTNGEIVFGNREFLMTCACSAGPAFEGGEISCGMRAADGAVEAVTLDKDTLEPTCRIIGGGRPAGLCGSGLIDLVAELLRCGAIDGKGKLIKEGCRIAEHGGIRRYILAFPEESAAGQEIALTEVDLDSLIRAKGAVYSAIDTMLASLELDMSAIERILVAGGIGSGIDLHNAVAIGMLPELPLEQIRYVGNTALAGACAMAVSDCALKEIEAIARNMTYVELSSHPGYMDRFVRACFLG